MNLIQTPAPASKGATPPPAPGQTGQVGNSDKNPGASAKTAATNGRRLAGSGARQGISTLCEAQGFGPLSAAAWADAIVAFWEMARQREDFDAQAPFDVLDLAPGRGATVWLMLQALRRRIAALPDFQPKLRYLASAPQRQLLLPLRSQEELKPLIADGSLVPVLWDPERGDPCLLTLTGRQPWLPRNPVVVLAHDRWSSLAQRLLAVHYGKLLEADLSQLERTPTSNDNQPRLWQPLGAPPLPAALDEMMQRYRDQFNSAPVPIPVGALRVIERIATLAPHGYLVIAAAPGATSERKLRLCHFGPLVNDYARTGSAPVNFHLLEQRYGELGAAVWQRDLYGDMATQLALGNMAGAASQLARTVSALDKGTLGGSAALVQAMKALSTKPLASLGHTELDTMLALLRQSEYDPEVFHAGGDSLTNALHAHADCNREAWSDALALVWSNHLAAATAPPLHRQLAGAAMQVGDWSLARLALRRGMAAHGEQAGDLGHLAWIAARTGAILDGQRLVARALALEPVNPIAREVSARIDRRLAGWDQEWNVQRRAPALGLSIEPLDLSHAEALLYQYRDPQIGVMTGLQALGTLDETRKWIADHVNEAGRRAYAIMHVDHGFVGYVCLSVSQADSYFCFWTGVDFQGRRYAGEAARLVFELARERGITTMFTSAYDDNVRSIRALQRIGFQAMTLRAMPPEGDRLFMFLRLGAPHVEDGASRHEGDPDAELVDYYRREKLAISFVGYPPYAAQDATPAAITETQPADAAAMTLQGSSS